MFFNYLLACIFFLQLTEKACFKPNLWPIFCRALSKICHFDFWIGWKNIFPKIAIPKTHKDAICQIWSSFNKYWSLQIFSWIFLAMLILFKTYTFWNLPLILFFAKNAYWNINTVQRNNHAIFPHFYDIFFNYSFLKILQRKIIKASAQGVKPNLTQIHSVVPGPIQCQTRA